MKDEFSEFKNLLKEKNDIIDVIGAYMKLERRGYNYWACCPFHHEKTPSFSINAADKFYYCFGCGASGDVISFVKEYENVDFMQAVRILADRAGLEVPNFTAQDSEKIAQKKQRKDRLQSLMRDAAHFYLNNLYSGNAEEHLNYLKNRGIELSTMKKFGLGASLDYTSLPSYLLAHGYTKEECIESGACSQSEKGRLFDAEGGRLIVPIINALGEVIAFGGRVLKKTDRGGKYKNTCDTEIFDKKKNLYNINLIKKEKQVGGIPYIILVEGYMDVISLYQAGFHNVGASMGTSLTKDQARLIHRYTDTVLISYDGDAAGQNANLRGLSILQQEGLKLRVVPLPEGLDPDDVIRKQGVEGYQKCLDAAMPLIDFRILCAQRKYDLKQAGERREFVKEALLIIREAESATEREELLAKLSSISGISYAALARDLENVKSEPQQQPAAPPLPKEDSDREGKAINYILCAALLSKPYALAVDFNKFALTGESKVIADYIMESRKQGRVRPSGIFDILGANSKKLSEVLNLDYGDNLDGPHAEKYFRDCVKTLLKKPLEEKLAAATAAYETASPEEKIKIAMQMNEYTKELKRL